MLEISIIVLGLSYFVESLLSKWFFYNWFRDWSINKGKFLYRLSNCMFCIAFWICVFSTIVVLSLDYLGMSLILTPFVVFGFYNFFSNDSRG